MVKNFDIFQHNIYFFDEIYKNKKIGNRNKKIHE
jgi:hypothetical protein